MNEKSKINILGLMSGTSLDGLDIALCSFEIVDSKYKYDIVKTAAYGYSNELKTKLSKCQNLSAFEFVKFHKDYGFYLGDMVNEFLNDCEIKPDYISSHGHTVFHQPDKNVTFQIGDGAAIAARTGLNVISDFRNLDVCLGGQGAPLVPIGDMLLFSEFDYCINIGGFANISYDLNGVRKAYDICPANIVLNKYAGYFNLEYDKDGIIGRSGKVISELLQRFSSIPYYKESGPKSLGREWLEDVFIPSIPDGVSHKDVMRTMYEHIAEQIGNHINGSESKVLLTGGGSHNSFLIELIKEKCNSTIIIPERELIDFKEALVFAFLGYLYINRINNCLESVTGASSDNIGGQLFYGRY